MIFITPNHFLISGPSPAQLAATHNSKGQFHITWQRALPWHHQWSSTERSGFHYVLTVYMLGYLPMWKYLSSLLIIGQTITTDLFIHAAGLFCLTVFYEALTSDPSSFEWRPPVQSQDQYPSTGFSRSASNKTPETHLTFITVIVGTSFFPLFSFCFLHLNRGIVLDLPLRDTMSIAQCFFVSLIFLWIFAFLLPVCLHAFLICLIFSLPTSLSVSFLSINAALVARWSPVTLWSVRIQDVSYPLATTRTSH